MITRLIEADAIAPARVRDTELAGVLPLLPTGTRVILIEDDDQVVGTWAMPRYCHVECLWIHPAHRAGAAIGRRLLLAMRAEAHRTGDRVVLTAALSDQVAALCLAFGGAELPGRHFVLPIGG